MLRAALMPRDFRCAALYAARVRFRSDAVCRLTAERERPAAAIVVKWLDIRASLGLAC